MVFPCFFDKNIKTFYISSILNKKLKKRIADFQLISGRAGCSIVLSVFFSVRLFVGRSGRAVGQTHSLPSFDLRIGWCVLAMCVAVKRRHCFLNCCKVKYQVFQCSNVRMV